MKRPTFLPGDAVCDELCLVTKSCPSLCVPMDCSPPGSSVHRILQARTLEWVAISSSKVSSQLRDRTYISYVGRQILYHRATWDEPADSLPAGNPGWGVSSGGQDGSQAQERSSQPLASPLGRSLSTPSFPPQSSFLTSPWVLALLPERSRCRDLLLLLRPASDSAQDRALLEADAAHVQGLRRGRDGVSQRG